MRGLLDKLSRSLAASSDEDLRVRITDLRAERRAFARQHALLEDAHAQIDAARAAVQAQLAETFDAQAEQLARLPLHGTAGHSVGHAELHRLFALAADDGYWSRLHAAVDAARERFSALSRSEYDTRLAEFDTRIRELEVELAARPARAARAEAEQELRALEQQARAALHPPGPDAA